MVSSLLPLVLFFLEAFEFRGIFIIILKEVPLDDAEDFDPIMVLKNLGITGMQQQTIPAAISAEDQRPIIATTYVVSLVCFSLIV